MKKLLSVSAMALVILAGCSSTTSYAGQSSESTEEGHEGEYATVTYDKSGDDITNTVFDVVLADGTSKVEYAASGEYGMTSDDGRTWDQHVESLDAYVDENDAFPTLDADGKDADGVSGATIGLSQFEEAFNAATEA